MKKFSVSELRDVLFPCGRTFLDKKEDILYFNWTASSVEFIFHGTSLNASFRADCGEEIEGLPFDENAPRRQTWPWVSVFLDDMPMPIRKFEVSSPNETWLLYQSREPQTHRIRLLKRTENLKTFLGLTAFHAEGEFLSPERPVRKRIEFVGDSITCGYGNMSQERDRGFFSDEEDGWLAYGVRAARQLDMEYSCVSVSGITALRYEAMAGEFAMEELYAYTDMVCQSKLGMAPEHWDFAAYKNDYVVVNLGTNDAFALLFNDLSPEDARFSERYAKFVRQIRDLNGPDTVIICALGSMDYYLYHDISRAVETYRQHSGDQNIYTCRFRPMSPVDGFGAAGHPSLATHEKMASELVRLIKTIEEDT